MDSDNRQLTGRVWGLALVALLASIFGAWATAASVFLVSAVIAGTCFAAMLFWLFTASRTNEAEAQRQAAEICRLKALSATAPGVWCHWSAGRSDDHRAADFADHLGLEPGSGFDDFVTGLAHDHATRLAGALDALRSGTGSDRFAMTVETADGSRSVEAVAGNADNSGGLVVWLRDVSDATAAAALAAERDRLRDTLDTLPLPLWRRDGDQTLVYCNKAYADIVETDAGSATAGDGIELVAEAEAGKTRRLAKEAQTSGEARTAAHHVIVHGARRLLKIAESPLGEETVGIGFDVTDAEETSRTLDQHIEAHAAVIERLTTAIVIFGPDKQLEFFNSAYAKLFDLDRDWLLTKPLLGEVLEVLRTARKLPEMADFPDFKKKREAMFTDLIEPLEEVQLQPDGSSVRLVAAPHPFGGLLFTFEDVTDTLALESSLNTQIAVQRATLDNLYEGVAVFGSDGRLKLRNPGFARIWRLSPEQLDGETHIAEVVEQTKEF